MSKTALITGISGQDGAYLAKNLLDRGYRVLGGLRRSARQAASHTRLEYLGVEDDVEMVDLELTEAENISRLMRTYKPDEIYNLAAQSFVAASWEQPVSTTDINALGTLRLLEAIRTYCPESRFYQASTSEMFGASEEYPQSESTPLYPRSPYGVAKVFGHWITINYRESFDMHCSSGILFNHESPLRGQEFVTRKVTLALSRIKCGLQSHVELGNLDSKRDWGFAGDYVEGMRLMLAQGKPDDYVLATGATYSIRHFCEAASRALDFDLEWEGEGTNELGIDRKSGKTIISINEKYYRPAEVALLIGDPSKAREKLGWEPQVTFESLVEMMTKADYDTCKKGNTPIG
jgi:GDPmannose 4,6-dehydratase